MLGVSAVREDVEEENQRFINEKKKKEMGEVKLLAQEVNKIIKNQKLEMPVTKETFMKICKGLNMHCTEILAYEGLIYCRGKNMENSAPEEFDFERMVQFLNMKSKVVAPASNPRIALTTKNNNSYRNNYFSLNQSNLSKRLPAI